MKIREVIVVEGKHDSEKLKKYFDCDTLETNGTHLSQSLFVLIQRLNEKRGVIVFTDPDYSGESIRNRINMAVPGCKQAFIDKKKARTQKKVGIEHASKEDLQEALLNVFTYQQVFEETINMEDFYALGLLGKKESQLKRAYLGELLHLGKANGKTLLKRLNMLGVEKEDIKRLLELRGNYE